MTQVKDISPVEIWTIFDQMLKIPRPSRHEKEIQDWAVSFGENLGLETLKDDAGNVIIRKPAAPGMENRKGVILQGHLDMVPQKNSDKEHNFYTDPIEAFIDGEWVTANGTTLGADNGIGVSSALAVLASKELKHGPVEVLLTATEETGMDGASGIKPGILKGEILINTDSEDEGELYVGCAGGIDANIIFNYSEEKVQPGYEALKLEVTGMKGGHSGIDIPLQRGNAIKIFFRIINETFNKTGVRLAELNCGGLRNAIPREAFGTLVLPKDNAVEFISMTEEIVRDIKGELSSTEPGIKVSVSKTDLPSKIINYESQVNITRSVVACPNGVIRMSDSMPGLVETSCNLAFVRTERKKVIAASLIRSSVDSSKEELAGRLKAVFELAGAGVSFSGSYPGWKPNMNSAILKTMQKIYKDIFDETPEIKAIHAGLECGILGGKYPEWDMISIGPTIRYPHSPDEKVNIETVRKFWKFLVATLENIPEK